MMFRARNETLRMRSTQRMLGEGRHDLIVGGTPQTTAGRSPQQTYIFKSEQIEWFSVPDGFQMNLAERF